jgi:hypothetical protein
MVIATQDESKQDETAVMEWQMGIEEFNANGCLINGD